MKKKGVFVLSIMLSVFLVVGLVSAIRINEIELNPESTDTGKEWVELYSSEKINITNWKLENNDNDVLNLKGVFQGYFIINFSGQWLDNSNEKVILKNSDDDVVDETGLLDDSSNNAKTWQYCSGNWNFTDSTKNSENSCGNAGDVDGNGDTNNGDGQEGKPEIYLELDWDEDEIINGEEFDIQIKGYNLANQDYDIKIFITDKDDEDNVISESYDEKDDKWGSSKFYVDNVFSGSGNKSEHIPLRIDSDYSDFSGDSDIIARIRKSGTSAIIDEIKESIEVLEKEEPAEEPVSEPEEIQEEETVTTTQGTGNVIRLGKRISEETETRDKTEESIQEGKVLYESPYEIIKKYGIYVFCLLLIIFIIILLKKKL